MPIIIPDYTEFTGGGKTKLKPITSPYGSSASYDSLLENEGLLAEKLASGELISQLRIRGSLTVNDGQNDVILIGYGKGLF